MNLWRPRDGRLPRGPEQKQRRKARRSGPPRVAGRRPPRSRPGHRRLQDRQTCRRESLRRWMPLRTAWRVRAAICRMYHRHRRHAPGNPEQDIPQDHGTTGRSKAGAPDRASDRGQGATANGRADDDPVAGPGCTGAGRYQDRARGHRTGRHAVAGAGNTAARRTDGIAFAGRTAGDCLARPGKGVAGCWPGRYIWSGSGPAPHHRKCSRRCPRRFGCRW